MQTITKGLVFASEEQGDKYLAEGKSFLNATSRFSSARGVTTYAIAEYAANRDGFTLFRPCWNSQPDERIPTMKTQPPDHTHLGDGAYASHDGYQIWLAANHHENRVVALDAGAIAALVEYAIRVGIYTPL